MQLIPRTTDAKRLVLLRHGRTAWNATGRAQGHADVSLDEIGRAQAAQAALHLVAFDPVFVWSSDLARARETAAEIVALTGQELVLDARLREIDVGVRQGLTFDEFAVAYPDIVARFRAGDPVLVPGAEPVDAIAGRMLAVLGDAVAALGPGDTGIVVGHGASLKIGLLAFLGAPDELSEMLAGMANCAWAVLELHRLRGWQIVDYNAQTLPEPLELADDLSASAGEG
jgi:broad specificity phosphatase PhoE